MKIAVSCAGDQIYGHFGHCEHFKIYTIENGEIASVEMVQNPGHRPGFLPNYLADLGATVMISGGMGGHAVEFFNARNVEVILGASGNPEEAVRGYLAGTLKSTGSICQEHEHAHECGGHGHGHGHGHGRGHGCGNHAN